MSVNKGLMSENKARVSVIQASSHSVGNMASALDCRSGINDAAHSSIHDSPRSIAIALPGLFETV